MKVKHLLCGIVVAILILYIFKILFHSGNGFSIGGQSDTCPGRTEKSKIGLPDEFLCIGDCNPCAGNPCHHPNGKCNPDGSCSCTPNFRPPNCSDCSASYNGPKCECLIVTNPEQCPIHNDSQTCCLLQTDCLYNASNGTCFKRNASCSEYKNKENCNTSGTKCKYCDASICDNGSETPMNKCFSIKEHSENCSASPSACKSASQCEGHGYCHTNPNNKCEFSCSCNPRYYTSPKPEMGIYKTYEGIDEPHYMYKGKKCKSVLYAGTAYNTNKMDANPTICTKDTDCKAEGEGGVCDKLTYSCQPKCSQGDTCQYLTDDYPEGSPARKFSTQTFNCTNASDNNSYCPFGLVANTKIRNNTNTLKDPDCQKRLCDPFNQNCSEVNQLTDLSTLKLFTFDGITGYDKATGAGQYCPSINYYELNNENDNCFVKHSDETKTDWCCSLKPGEQHRQHMTKLNENI